MVTNYLKTSTSLSMRLEVNWWCAAISRFLNKFNLTRHPRISRILELTGRLGHNVIAYECLIIFMIELCYISMTYMYINVRTNLNAFISIFDEKLRREERRRRAQLL